MPVSLRIQDGPAGTEYFSPAVLPGTLNRQVFTNRSNSLQRGTYFDFKVTVRNDGNEAASGPSGPTGSFVVEDPLIGQVSNPGPPLAAPDGQSTISIDATSGQPQLVLSW